MKRRKIVIDDDVTALLDTVLEKSTSVCLCFCEFVGDKISYHLKNIDVKSLLSSAELNPRHIFDFNLPDKRLMHMGWGAPVTKQGSEFIFAGGFNAELLRSYSDDSSWNSEMRLAAEPSREVCSLGLNCLKTWCPFQRGKSYPLLWQVGDKLYAISRWPKSCLYATETHSPLMLAYSSSFEEYDPMIGCWSSLPDPPCYRSYSPTKGLKPLNFSYVIAGSNLYITGSDCDTFKIDVNVADPKWKKVNFPSLSASQLPLESPDPETPSLNESKTLAVNVKDDSFVVFAYDFTAHPNHISANMISVKDDSFTPLPSIQLPEDIPENLWLEDCFFVHIADNMVCLLLSGITPHIKPEMHIRFVTFQFEVFDDFSCHIHFLPTRTMVYGAPSRFHGEIQMCGAFIL